MILSSPLLLAETRINVVPIFVSVTDNKGQPVNDLTKDNFVIYEDKIKQELFMFKSLPSPTSIGIIVDTSGSMRVHLDKTIAACRYLLRKLAPDDEACVLSFKRSLELASSFTKDREKLDQALLPLMTGGGSSIIDALYASSHYVSTQGKNQNKVLLLFTDGLDKNSAGKEKPLIDAFQKNGVRVFVVAFIEEDDGPSLFGKPSAKSAKEFVTRIAESSGGQSVFPKKVNELQPQLDRYLNFIQTPYLLAYDPSNSQASDKFRKWKIELQGITNRKLKVFAPEGYFLLPPKK